MMHRPRLPVIAPGASVLALLIFAFGAAAQEKPGAGDSAATQNADTESRERELRPEGVPAQADLEERFRETLTGATLTGRWRLVDGGELGTEREEKYSIRSAKKISRDYWLISARIEYAGRDVTVPVPVKVLWAGDTPVITVTDLNIPGLGTYTARVMFYRDLYTGTWFGPGHGGLMSGSIVKAEPPAPGGSDEAEEAEEAEETEETEEAEEAEEAEEGRSAAEDERRSP